MNIIQPVNEFSHSLALERTRPSRRGCTRGVADFFRGDEVIGFPKPATSQFPRMRRARARIVVTAGCGEVPAPLPRQP